MQTINPICSPDNAVSRVYAIGQRWQSRVWGDDAVQDIAIRAYEHPERYLTDAQITLAIANRRRDYLRRDRADSLADLTDAGFDPADRYDTVSTVITSDLRERYPYSADRADGYTIPEIAERHETTYHHVCRTLSDEKISAAA